MEAKLKEYRQLRRRKAIIEKSKENIKKVRDRVVDFFDISRFIMKEEEEEVILIPQEPEEEDEEELIVEEEEVETLMNDKSKEESWTFFCVKWILYFVVWVTLFLCFVQLQFGAVFFVISILIFICLNTRTSPRRKGEVSAYSVFNRNCEAIDGTLKAEQFEREIRYGAQSVR